MEDLLRALGEKLDFLVGLADSRLCRRADSNTSSMVSVQVSRYVAIATMWTVVVPTVPPQKTLWLVQREGDERDPEDPTSTKTSAEWTGGVHRRAGQSSHSGTFSSASQHRAPGYSCTQHVEASGPPTLKRSRVHSAAGRSAGCSHPRRTTKMPLVSVRPG